MRSPLGSGLDIEWRGARKEELHHRFANNVIKANFKPD